MTILLSIPASTLLSLATPATPKEDKLPFVDFCQVTANLEKYVDSNFLTEIAVEDLLSHGFLARSPDCPEEQITITTEYDASELTVRNLRSVSWLMSSGYWPLTLMEVRLDITGPRFQVDTGDPQEVLRVSRVFHTLYPAKQNVDESALIPPSE